MPSAVAIPDDTGKNHGQAITQVRTQCLKPVNGAKTSNATHIGQSTMNLASEPKFNINEKQSSGASKTVEQARACRNVCAAFSLNGTLSHMTCEGI